MYKEDLNNVKLEMKASVVIYNILLSSGAYFHKSYVSSDFETLFGRQALECWAVNKDINNRYYIYLLSSHNPAISHDALFSSILVVPVSAFLTKDTTKATKYHVVTDEDLAAFMADWTGGKISLE